MPKPPPEKLAAALRANLKRRKGLAAPEGPRDGGAAPGTPARPAAGSPQKAPDSPLRALQAPPKNTGEA